MKNRRTHFFIALLIAFLSGVSFSALAQPGDPTNGDPDAPITGIEILVGVGSLIGLKKAHDARKKNQKP